MVVFDHAYFTENIMLYIEICLFVPGQWITDIRKATKELSWKRRDASARLETMHGKSFKWDNFTARSQEITRTTVEWTSPILKPTERCSQDVAPKVNLPLVCSKLVACGFFSGVVDLCVACASKLDPQNKAVHYYKSDQPSQDREGHLNYYRR